MLTSTTFAIDKYEIIENKGIVHGIIVRSPNIAQGILGNLKSIIGGKIGAFKEMCEQTRDEAFTIMEEQAKAAGANAIVGVRFDTSDIGAGATEVFCYGTAVVVKKV